MGATIIETAHMKLQKLAGCQELYHFIQQNEPVRLYFSPKRYDPNLPTDYFHIREPELLNYISAPAILYNKTIILAINRFDNVICSDQIHIVRLNKK